MTGNVISTFTQSRSASPQHAKAGQKQQATQGTTQPIASPQSLLRARMRSEAGPRHPCSDLSGADRPAEGRLTPTEQDVSR